jgi:hypothetical protein
MTDPDGHEFSILNPLIPKLHINFNHIPAGSKAVPVIKGCKRCFIILQWPNSSRRVSKAGTGDFEANEIGKMRFAQFKLR